MSDVLLADDPLYEELYDVRREAEAMGNFIERDVTAEIATLRAQAPVHQGKLRELLDLLGHDRHANGIGRQHYTVLSYEACEAAFRNPGVFSNTIQMDPRIGEKGTGLLEIDPPRHRAYRRTVQPKFQMNEATSWWRTRTIDSIVEQLIERLARHDRAELNIDYCARIPVYTITTAIGLHGDEALRFRHAYLNSTSSSRNIPMAQRIANFPPGRNPAARPGRRTAPPAAGRSHQLPARHHAQPARHPAPPADRRRNHHSRQAHHGGRRWHLVAPDRHHPVRAADPSRAVGRRSRPTAA